MAAPSSYYPEFDSIELDELIAPLAHLDRQVAELLVTAAPAAAGAASPVVATWCAGAEQYPFQRIVRTLAAGIGADPLAAHAAALEDLDAARVEWLARVEGRLREVWVRPLVAAVNAARRRGRLAGTGPHARYQHFVATVVAAAAAPPGHDTPLPVADRVSDAVADLAGTAYPVLREVTRVVLAHEVAAVAELLERLRADRPAIATGLGVAADDAVTSFGFAAGDTHHGGRSVAVLAFRSGARLVHKPRDVSCEAAWERLVPQVNDRFGTTLAAARVLERDGYGWVEHIGTDDVEDPAGFLRASGELAAVLHLLDARDMHMENIVPTRRGPVPIDLETILHPPRLHGGAVPEAPGNAYDTLSRSIYGIGILPLVMVGRDESAGHIDLGFLGGAGSGGSPFRSLSFAEPFTDRVRLEWGREPAPARHTVVGELTEAQVHDLGDAMADGFTTVLRAVLADRAGWLAIVRATLAAVRVRYVHNPTVLYVQTLRMTAGAGALDDPDAHAALLKRIAIASRNSSPAVVAAEVRQLAVRDVPYFVVASTGTALQDGAGRDVGARFDRSPLDQAVAKVWALDEAALAEQLRLLYSAFSARFPDNHLTPVRSTAGRGTGGGGSGALAAVVRRLGDEMVATSKPDRFAHLPRTWIGPLASAQRDRPWPPGVLGYDLYTGRVGPALALAASARVLDVPAHRALAEQVFTSTAEILAQRQFELRSVRQAGFAAYTGTAGLLFALAAAGRLLERTDWVDAAQGALPLVLDQVRDLAAERPDAVPLDMISGVAGALSAALGIGGPHAAAAVATLVPLLTAGVRRAGPATQSGFAHGVAGSVYALARALPHVPAAGRPEVRRTLGTLFGQLQGFFDDDEGDWSSDVATPDSFATGWCHGASGIALALSAHAAAEPGDGAVAAARDTAVANVVRRGFGRNLTWCHGDLGSHDVLAGLAEPPAGELARVERTWLAAEVLERKLADRRSRYAHTTSLMVGTAGVVLHLVRRLDPAVRVSPVALTIGERS